MAQNPTTSRIRTVDPAGQLLVDLENFPEETALPVGGDGASILELEAVLKDPLC
jgi:hypothetical protein